MRSKYEIKAQKELEAEGYQIDWKIKPHFPPRGYSTDIFGWADIMAVKQGSPLRFISIKGHQGISRQHRESIQKFWLPENCIKEIWYFPKRKKKKNRRFIKKIIK